MEKPSFVEADLNALAQEAGKVIRQSLPPDIRLELKLSDGLPLLRFDQEQVQSVLENLALSAVNAMPEGGKITIRTELAQSLQ